MNFPVTSKHIFSQVRRAIENFERREISFAAVKLNISMQITNKKEIDEMVEENFRSEKDLILNNQRAYIILMHDTTIEAAESAVKRLKIRLDLLNPYGRRLKDINQVHATAYIIGSKKGTPKLQIRYLDLSSQLNFKKRVDNLKLSFNEYLRWLEIPKNNDSLAINIKV